LSLVSRAVPVPTKIVKFDQLGTNAKVQADVGLEVPHARQGEGGDTEEWEIALERVKVN